MALRDVVRSLQAQAETEKRKADAALSQSAQIQRLREALRETLVPMLEACAEHLTMPHIETEPFAFQAPDVGAPWLSNLVSFWCRTGRHDRIVTFAYITSAPDVDIVHVLTAHVPATENERKVNPKAYKQHRNAIPIYASPVQIEEALEHALQDAGIVPAPTKGKIVTR